MALIVIVDDRASNRTIFSRLAASVEPGVTVAAFADPREALAWLDKHPPDFVITDYQMPNLDGAEFTRRLRIRWSGADFPIMMITASEDSGFRRYAFEAGVTECLQSPVDHQEFLSVARASLQRARAIPTRVR
jgi:CheY-like chemotaxis protein